MRHQSLLKTGIAASIGIACLAATAAVRAVDREGASPPISGPTLFLAENEAAMGRMMSAMAVKPTGDVDADFVATMIPHHQGAIDMAVAVLRYGKNEQIRRIAQEIVVEQQQEIDAMHLALGRPPRPSAPAPTQTGFLTEQAPSAGRSANLPVTSHDRVYAAEQFSNTVSVTDPASNRLLGVIRLGDPQPANFSPLYKGQVLVHGLGFSPDGKTLAVVSIGSNGVTVIDTATNAVKHTTYVGRSPHEAFFTPDGKELWVTVRGENYVAVLSATTFEEKTRIKVPAGPGMQIFSPDGKYGYVCSSFNPETVVITVADHRIVGHVKQASPFCPNIAATPDGKQIWFTLKDLGKTQVFDARPPFGLIKTLDTGPITNHVNFAHNARGTFAYVTVGGLNEIKVFRTDTFEQVATIPVDKLPHGIWPSADGSRVYVGLENADTLAAIDTLTNKVIANIPVGQAPQAVVYVPNAVPDGDGTANLQPLGAAGAAAHFTMQSTAAAGGGEMPTSVSLFDQGLTQILQASVTRLEPQTPYVLGLSSKRDGTGAIEPLSGFMTNPAGSAMVIATGPIRQIVNGDAPDLRRYLVVAEGTPARVGAVVQRQVSN